MDGIVDIDLMLVNYIAGRFAGEYLRQVKDEGYTSEHDDAHDKGELAEAAAAYAWPPSPKSITANSTREMRDVLYWPFDDVSFKPGDGSIEGRLQELNKAGGLLIAEYLRLNRLRAKEVNNG